MRKDLTIQPYPIPMGIETSVKIPTECTEMSVGVINNDGVEVLALFCLSTIDNDDFVDKSLYLVPVFYPFDPYDVTVGAQYPNVYSINGVNHHLFERVIIEK